MESADLRLSVKKTQNRATIIGIQGNCQMENRSVKSKEYWNIGVMGKWVGETAASATGAKEKGSRVKGALDRRQQTY